MKETTIAAIPPELDVLAAEAMAEWKVPGLAIAIVQDGETALLKAYGQRDVEAGLAVTPQTQFTICSITKTFTATGLALLVDEGRLDWSKPVRDYVPEFRLHDPVATERVTVRDLLCHHSGLPRHDWIWMPGGLSRAEMLAAMRYIEPSRDVRTDFQYSNLGYNAASVVAERASGLGWEEFTRTRLAEPLGMSMTFKAEDLAAADDAATPYAMHREQRRRTRLWPIRATAAGGINTSIMAIANWMSFLLGAKGPSMGGVSCRRPLFASCKSHVFTPGHRASPNSVTATTAWASVPYTYRGEQVVGHSGGWIGWSTLIRLMPARKLGVAVFTNLGGAPVPGILVNHVFDRLCGKEPVPWRDRLRDLRRKGLAQEQVDEETQKTARKPNTQPSHHLAEYAGTYDHPGYGQMIITRTGDALRWAIGDSRNLVHRHYDTFEVPQIPYELNPDRLAITFTTDRDGNIASLSVQPVAMVADIVFRRAPAGDCMDAGFRKTCVGRYKYGAVIHVVSQDADDQLTLKPDYQPLYRLRPYQGGIFTIVELEGFRVEFRRGDDGAVRELVFHQPNGTFIARRDD